MYRDNNNFLQFNSINTKDHRLFPWRHGHYHFLKVDKGPVWTSSSYDATHSTSYNGKDFKPETHQILFGSFFFLSNIKSTHTRDVYNIVNLLTELGGIYCSFYALMKSLGTYINSQLYVNKLVGSLTFKKLSKKTVKEEPSLMKKSSKISSDIYAVKYGYLDIFSDMYIKVMKICCCKCTKKPGDFLSASQKMY